MFPGAGAIHASVSSPSVQSQKSSGNEPASKEGDLKRQPPFDATVAEKIRKLKESPMATLAAVKITDRNSAIVDLTAVNKGSQVRPSPTTMPVAKVRPIGSSASSLTVAPAISASTDNIAEVGSPAVPGIAPEEMINAAKAGKVD